MFRFTNSKQQFNKKAILKENGFMYSLSHAFSSPIPLDDDNSNDMVMDNLFIHAIAIVTEFY